MQNARRLSRNSLFAGIVHLPEADIADHLSERLAVMCIPGDGECAVCAPVEGIFESHDIVIFILVLQPCILHRGLERPLVRFRAGVCEEHAVHSGNFLQALCRADARLIVEIIRGVDDLINLRLECVIVFFVVVSERKNGDAGHKIKIFLPGDIIKIHSVAAVEHDLITVVRMKEIPLRLIDHLFLFF